MRLVKIRRTLRLHISFQEKSLEDLLEYVPCPCKSVNKDEPMAAMIVNMKTEGLKEDFDGVFDVSVRTTKESETAGGNFESIEPIEFTVPVRRSLWFTF